MKKITFILFALIAGTTFAQDNHSLTVQASAQIVSPIALTNGGTPLNFGQITSGPAGTVTINADTGEATGSAHFISESNSTAQNFNVTGQSNISYTITVPTSAVAVTGPATGMTITDFTTNKTDNIGTLVSGTDSFSVGATLNVGASQAEGNYTADYSVTVTYN